MPACSSCCSDGPWSLVTEGLGGEDLGGLPGWIESGQEADEEGAAGDPKGVDGAGFEGDVAEGVDFGVEGDPAVVFGEVAEAVAESEAEGGADAADEEALEDEDAADLIPAGAHGDEDRDVPIFLHDHHDEADEDVEGSD